MAIVKFQEKVLKKIFIIISFLFCLCLLSLNSSNHSIFAAETKEYDNFYEITFPQGTFLYVVLNQPIDTSKIQVEDIVETYFPTDMYLGEILVIPKGSKAYARITSLEKAHQGRNSMINLRFYYIKPLGDKYSETMINAIVCDKNGDGSIGGALTEKTGLRLVAHKLEMIGTIDQAVPTGERAPGKEMYIPTGERWVIQLLQPATFTVYK